MDRTKAVARRISRVVALTAMAAGLALIFIATPANAVTGPEVTPQLIPFVEDNNPTCSEFARSGQSWTEVKWPDDKTQAQGDVIADSNVTITITNRTDKTFDWALTSGAQAVVGIDAVLVKAGAGGHYLYRYDDPQAQSNFGEATADDGLTTPNKAGADADSNQISHITFCYDLGGPTTTTTEESTTTTTQQVTTTTAAPTTTTAGTTGDTVASVEQVRQTEVAGVVIEQPAPAAAQLARTGSDWMLPGLGVVLVGFGALLLRFSRRPATVS